MADICGSSVNYDPEAELLPQHSDSAKQDLAGNHSVRTAPVFTSEALNALGPGIIPQRAVYGSLLFSYGGNSLGSTESTLPSKLYVNTNAPFSAVVCGLQGSGKSHSTSVLLEGCLIQDPRLGTLPAPLCGLLFHFDSASGSGYVQPCEAAYLASMDAARGGNAIAPEVTVLVMPNRVEAMRHVYANLPGVKVEALRFASEDISGERLLAMMKVDENNQMPLYMELIMTLLRDMEVFDYNEFRVALAQQRLNGSQKSMLNLRLALLDSCLKGGDENNCVTKYFKQGALTIVEYVHPVLFYLLPLLTPPLHADFFDVILSLFVEAEVGTGKIIVLGEAHKYLSDTGHSSKLTDSLLSIIRQQRHLNARVVISTQEPTVVPSKFLELSSFIIAHRFSSPKWLQHLAEHVSAAQAVKDEIFEKIIDLRTGEGIMFAPSGLGVKPIKIDSSSTSAVTPFGQGYLVVHSRQRVTRDGGHSLLAVQNAAMQTRLGRIAAPRIVRNTTIVETSLEVSTNSPIEIVSSAPDEAVCAIAKGIADLRLRSLLVDDIDSPNHHMEILDFSELCSRHAAQPTIFPAEAPANSSIPLIPVGSIKTITSMKSRNKNAAILQTPLCESLHLPIILRILQEREAALFPYAELEKKFRSQCSIETTTVSFKEFLVKQSKAGAIVFGFFQRKGAYTECYVKLPDP